MTTNTILSRRNSGEEWIEDDAPRGRCVAKEIDAIRRRVVGAASGKKLQRIFLTEAKLELCEN